MNNNKTHSTQSPKVITESLLSLENLDRASPEIWPERIPGISSFETNNLNTNAELQPWHKGLNPDDFSYLQKLTSMSTSKLIMEVKRLHDVAYDLGVKEAKEMTRGKYINIFARNQ